MAETTHGTVPEGTEQVWLALNFFARDGYFDDVRIRPACPKLRRCPIHAPGSESLNVTIGRERFVVALRPGGHPTAVGGLETDGAMAVVGLGGGPARACLPAGRPRALLAGPRPAAPAPGRYGGGAARQGQAHGAGDRRRNAPCAAAHPCELPHAWNPAVATMNGKPAGLTTVGSQTLVAAE